MIGTRPRVFIGRENAELGRRYLVNIGGILVFGEPIGSGALGISARMLAFCLVIAGAALVPTPRRATSDYFAPQTVPN